MRYLALLRGINVGGHRIIPMAKLRGIVEEAGFAEVSTYIQSGNVVFTSPSKSAKGVRTAVESALRTSLGYEVPALIRTAKEMETIVSENPFSEEHTKGRTKMYVAFLEHGASKQEMEALLAAQVKGMRFHAGTAEVYCLLDAKFTGNDSPFSNTLLEKLLGQRATTRNWATTTTLLEMMIP